MTGEVRRVAYAAVESLRYIVMPPEAICAAHAIQQEYRVHSHLPDSIEGAVYIAVVDPGRLGTRF